MKFIPRVSLSGTPINTLIDSRANAMNAIRDAMKALEETAPHARDFQHDRTGQEYTAARDVYVRRFAMLDKLWNELDEETQAIDNQYAEQRRK